MCIICALLKHPEAESSEGFLGGRAGHSPDDGWFITLYERLPTLPDQTRVATYLKVVGYGSADGIDQARSVAMHIRPARANVSHGLLAGLGALCEHHSSYRDLSTQPNLCQGGNPDLNPNPNSTLSTIVNRMAPASRLVSQVRPSYFDDIRVTDDASGVRAPHHPHRAGTAQPQRINAEPVCTFVHASHWVSAPVKNGGNCTCAGVLSMTALHVLRFSIPSPLRAVLTSRSMRLC